VSAGTSAGRRAARAVKDLDVMPDTLDGLSPGARRALLAEARAVGLDPDEYLARVRRQQADERELEASTDAIVAAIKRRP